MKVRKIVAGLAALSMLASFSAQAVAAADTVSLTGENVTVAAGGEAFTLNVEMGGVPADGVSVCEFALTYDPSVITVSDVKLGDIAPSGVDDAEKWDGVTAFETDMSTSGVITVTYSSGLTDPQYRIKQDGVFLVVSGKVADSAKEGDSTPVEITGIDRAATEGSTEKNDGAKVGYLGVDDSGQAVAVKYGVTTKAGSVTVGKSTTTEPNTDDSQSGTEGNVMYMYGDVTLDGVVNLADVVSANKFMMNAGEELNDQAIKNGDVDVDGKIGPNDVLNILMCVIELISQSDFPIQAG